MVDKPQNQKHFAIYKGFRMHRNCRRLVHNPGKLQDTYSSAPNLVTFLALHNALTTGKAQSVGSLSNLVQYNLNSVLEIIGHFPVSSKLQVTYNARDYLLLVTQLKTPTTLGASLLYKFFNLFRGNEMYTPQNIYLTAHYFSVDGTI